MPDKAFFRDGVRSFSNIRMNYKRMASQHEVEKLRAKNISLIKDLQKRQHDLRASMQSAIANRGNSSKQTGHGIRQKNPKKLNVQFERIPVDPTSPIQHKEGHRLTTTRLTSTPKYVPTTLDRTTITNDLPEHPRSPGHVAQLSTDTPNRLYEGFLDESKSAFGRKEGKLLSVKTAKPTNRYNMEKTGSNKQKTKSASHKRHGFTPRKSPKLRPRTSPGFSTSPSSKERPLSRQMDTSSFLPPPLKDKENQRGQRSRYGYRRPLDLAHEESYYQLNRDSPQNIRTGRDGAGTSFAEQLLAEGNDRQHTRVTTDAARPKSILLTPGGRLNKSRNKVSFHHSPDVSLMSNLNETAGNQTQPLLGYDWIAGLLDSDSPTNEHSESFFDELRQFRQANREECVHRSIAEGPNISASFQSVLGSGDDLEEPVDADKHTCIHNYTLNPRLFAVPLHGTQSGESMCAICNERRRPKNLGTSSPSYVRVSIPRSTLASPYRLRPHRRKSYDPTDSVGLSQHCLAGWESSKPSMLPTASNIDLKDSVDLMASNALNLMDYPTHQSSSHSSKAPRMSKYTQDLLNRSHKLRLDLHKLERAGMSVAQLPLGANSTSYPVL